MVQTAKHTESKIKPRAQSLFQIILVSCKININFLLFMFFVCFLNLNHTFYYTHRLHSTANFSYMSVLCSVMSGCSKKAAPNTPQAKILYVKDSMKVDDGTKYVNRKVKYLFASVEAKLEENRRTHMENINTTQLLRIRMSFAFR